MKRRGFLGAIAALAVPLAGSKRASHTAASQDRGEEAAAREADKIVMLVRSRVISEREGWIRLRKLYRVRDE